MEVDRLGGRYAVGSLEKFCFGDHDSWTRRLSIAVCNLDCASTRLDLFFGLLMFRRIESSNGVLVGEYGIGIVAGPGLLMLFMNSCVPSPFGLFIKLHDHRSGTRSCSPGHMNSLLRADRRFSQ